nr:MAG TPA: Lacto-N-biose phosphorylase [Bacteriophage sp.]
MHGLFDLRSKTTFSAVAPECAYYPLFHDTISA